MHSSIWEKRGVRRQSPPRTLLERRGRAEPPQRSAKSVQRMATDSRGEIEGRAGADIPSGGLRTPQRQSDLTSTPSAGSQLSKSESAAPTGSVVLRTSTGSPTVSPDLAVMSTVLSPTSVASASLMQQPPPASGCSPPPQQQHFSSRVATSQQPQPWHRKAEAHFASQPFAETNAIPGWIIITTISERLTTVRIKRLRNTWTFRNRYLDPVCRVYRESDLDGQDGSGFVSNFPGEK